MSIFGVTDAVVLDSGFQSQSGQTYVQLVEAYLL